MHPIDIIKQKLEKYHIESKKNRDINCVVHDLYDSAVLKSKKFTDDQKNGRLFGKLFAVKDNINIKNHPTTCASNILKNHKSIYNATVIERIENAGGLIVAKTNLDEFAMGSSNEHSIFGISRNPHNLDYVCGGSSGGSAGVVSAKLVDVALGSDTGGSVRQPASFCGVYGLKPTYGRISRHGLTAFASSFDQIGIFSNELSDLIDSFEVISGQDDKDSTTSKIKNKPFQYCESSTKKMKIGIPKEYLEDTLDTQVRKKIDSMIDFLEKNNFMVKNITLPLTKKCISVYYILSTAEAASNLSRYDGVVYGHRDHASNIQDMYKKTRSFGFGNEVKRRIILGTFILSSGYYDSFYNKALKFRRLIKNDFLKAFDNVDLILTPTSPSTAFKVGEKINDPIKMYLSDIYTVPMSLAGLPAMNFPAGYDSEKMPIGLQLTSSQFQENKIFSLAKFIRDNFN
tara:strand:+ start:5511 stop:6881 length:1371 start_codon:yes stop_codon:yes gene_type:complete